MSQSSFELFILAWIRARFFGTSFVRSFAMVTVGGMIIAGVSVGLGAAS